MRANGARPLLLAAWAFFGTGACSRNEAVLAGGMSGPAGLVVAGTQHDRVYVAMRGLDALQVVDAHSALPQLQFVTGPARYFPLHVPVGPSPTELSASADGRYVFVLDGLHSEVWAVDADAAVTLRDAADAPLRAGAGPSEARAVALVGHPWAACAPSEVNPQTTCVGRTYVALEGLGAVAAVDVRRAPADGTLSLQLDATYVVGGAPRALAVHPSLPVVFVADAAGKQVARLTVADGAGAPRGAVDRVPVRGVPGPLAISGDGTVLVVARPENDDVLLLVADARTSADEAARNLAFGALQPQPKPSVVGPTPSCLQACGELQTAGCQDAHPADASLCVAPDGYRAVAGRGYDGLWLGSPPQALVALSGSTAFPQPLQLVCHGAPQHVQAVPHALAVATFDGGVHFLGFGPDAPFAAAGSGSLLDLGFCEAPSATPLDPQARAQASDVLAASPSAPVGDARFAALTLAEGRGPQLGLWRGQLREQTFRLVWEGVLPGGDQPGGNGAIDAQGRFYDVAGGVDRLATLGLVAQRADRFAEVVTPGDVLEILTETYDEAGCGERVDGRVRPCSLERRIVGVEQAEGSRRLVLDAPLPARCFAGPIGYRVRAGDAFLVGPSVNEQFVGTPVRLGPGEAYGPGRSKGQQTAAFFAIDANLDVGAGVASCARYAPGGGPAEGAPAWRSRQGALSFTVADPYLRLQGARSAALDPTQQPTQQPTGGTVGQLPYAAVVAPAVPGPRPGSETNVRGPLLWVSYFASGGLLALDPSDSRKVGVGEAGRLLQ